MNLYRMTIVLTVEAENADEASDSVYQMILDTISWPGQDVWIKDRDIVAIHKLPLVRSDEDG